MDSNAQFISFLDSQGPVLPNPLKEPKDATGLNWGVDVTEKMKGTLDAITLTRTKLEGKVPLLGFTGAPVNPFVKLLRRKHLSVLLLLLIVDPFKLHD